ncbi:hypothetical protein [Micromonospora zamorensis]|uniref:hypothetical protein n=1 Tax=Micromonospora zamorensis TaxID=709883 RepID=UPI0033A20C77
MPDQLSDTAKARKDLLWGMYADLRLHSRHAETLRSNVVNFSIVIASLLIAAISADGHVRSSDLALCLGVVCVGLLGLGFAASYTELHERNRRRAVRLRDALDAEFLSGPEPDIEDLLEESDRSHEAGRLYRWSRAITGSTQRFWFALPVLVLVSGVTLTAVAA